MKNSSNDMVSALYEKKLQKIAEQKRLSDQMNEVLTKCGGLNECSKLTRKNLQAAIAVSQQPGDFEYYRTPDEVKQLENDKYLNKLASSIHKVHCELEQINAEIQKSAVKAPAAQPDFPVNSLSQWFDIYGRPKVIDNDLMTTFSPSPKIYGGTAHHRSFKTQSLVMRKGRLTR